MNGKYLNNLKQKCQIKANKLKVSQAICQTIFQTFSHATYNMSKYSTYLQYQPCLRFWIFFGTQMMGGLTTRILSQNPNISNFPNQIKTTKQGRKPYLKYGYTAQWGRCRHARKHFFLQILSRHMYLFVFLNFKRGFFS